MSRSGIRGAEPLLEARDVILLLAKQPDYFHAYEMFHPSRNNFYLAFLKALVQILSHIICFSEVAVFFLSSSKQIPIKFLELIVTYKSFQNKHCIIMRNTASATAIVVQ